MAHLSTDFRAHLRFFAFYLANGTVAEDIIPVGTDYTAIFREPSALEQVFAIWANVLECDATGAPANASTAQRRAAQYIRSYIDPSYEVEPPFTDEELELYI